MQYKLVKIRSVTTDGMGTLSFFESERDIPFDIKRIYYIYGVNAGVERGAHAHIKLRQLIFCPYGSVIIKLDDGNEVEEILLDSPDQGLILEPGLWRDMVWKIDNSVLCVAVSDYYDANDYIREYSEFLNYCNKDGKK